MSDANTDRAVGIDLGTTFSVVACLDADGKPQTITNAEGDLTTPSVVYFCGNDLVVGKEAVKVAAFEPESIAQFAKRDVGKKEFHKAIRNHQLPPEVIESIILKKLKHDAELRIGKITKAVITVPAFFNEPRRKATMDAGRLAGIEVLDIINEPTAAAIASGVQLGYLTLDGTPEQEETVLIYDLGGGTFDATLLKIHGREFTAVATAGDVYLGGIDWDQRIVDYVAEAFETQHGDDPRQEDEGQQNLMQEAEDAKRALSSRDSVTIHFAHQGKRISLPLTREKFVELTADLLQRTIFTTQKLLRDSKYSWNDVTRLLLVGGSTRMPMVQQALEKEFGKPVDRSLSPDEAVAHGAALYAGVLLGGPANRIQMQVTNVSSHDLGVLGIERSTNMPRRKVLIARNSPLPATGVRRFTTQKDNQRSVVVNVIEGGDASGKNATPIGKCVVSDLPPGLKAKTPVIVKFKYDTNGRLSVSAKIPEVDRMAKMNIERASGLADEDIEQWRGKLSDGVILDPSTELGPISDKQLVEPTAEETFRDLDDLDEIDDAILEEADFLGEDEEYEAEKAASVEPDGMPPVAVPVPEEDAEEVEEVAELEVVEEVEEADEPSAAAETPEPAKTPEPKPGQKKDGPNFNFGDGPATKTATDDESLNDFFKGLG